MHVVGEHDQLVIHVALTQKLDQARHLLERNIYFPPSQYEALFVSAAHSASDIEHTVQAIREFSVQP